MEKTRLPIAIWTLRQLRGTERSIDFDCLWWLIKNRDVAIYALGVGACGQDAVDSDELKFVYHENGQEHIQVSISQ